MYDMTRRGRQEVPMVWFSPGNMRLSVPRRARRSRADPTTDTRPRSTERGFWWGELATEIGQGQRRLENPESSTSLRPGRPDRHRSERLLALPLGSMSVIVSAIAIATDQWFSKYQG